MPVENPSAAEKRELIQRIVNSTLFASSQALKSFLLFITEHALNGDIEEIKEQHIGAEVLGRRADYDPASDNIVRVRAHDLRQRLTRYFDTIGASEPVVLTIPKGSYVPVFQLRSLAGAPLEGGPVEPPRHASWTDAQWSAVRDLWGQFFTKTDKDLTVVAADAAFALWQDISSQNLTLGDYLSRKYLEVGDPMLREIAVRRCIAPADLVTSLRLADISQAFGGHLKPQYARTIGMADLRGGNAVILGSRRSNPWVQLFESNMNFVLGQDTGNSGPRFENRSPIPGESESFGIPCRLDIEGTERREMESYALVALVPNLSDTGHVMILEGLSMEGTEAAGETVTNPERLSAMLRQIGHKPGTPVGHFEALLKLISIPGGYVSPSLIAYRYPGRPVAA